MMSCSNQLETTEKSAIELKGADRLYVRGVFNGWGTVNEFKPVDSALDNQRYRTQVSVGMGIHAFKVASEDWSIQLLVENTQVIDLERDQGKPLNLIAQNVDFNSQILTSKPARFDLVLDRSISPALLYIENVVFQTERSDAPHVGAVTTLTYKGVDDEQLVASFSQQKIESKSPLRTYVHETTQLLRDPVPHYSVYREQPNLPYTRTGHVAFDALFALAMDEMRLNSVQNIQDGNYNLGQAIDCQCFETGEKWNYVWTRDLSYAASLGLGFFDPARVVNSLLFKTSMLRAEQPISRAIPWAENGYQIMQDTGSGGSWPVSTDRVTWSFGAESVLANLSGDARHRFVTRALDALTNTILVDRKAVFNPTLGLYQGEQSFLDWREQSYAAWIVDDLSSMSTSFSLSTNVAHYKALTVAAKLANELGQRASATQYNMWATQLKQSINAFFWLPEKGLYSSLSSGHYFPIAMEKFDWLGQALAINTGVADQEKSERILKNYPHSQYGPPVIFPQQPNIQIYHNRAIWPFVTAFGLQAAKQGNNSAVATNAIESLIRGAALNLSNMENLEWLSGQSIWLDRGHPSLSGPAINSKRQLWSVAGYINMVVNGIFGIETNDGVFAIEPYIPTDIAMKYFAGQDEITLSQVNWLGKKLSVTLQLPTSIAANHTLLAANISLNGKVISGQELRFEQLGADNEIKVTLKQSASQSEMTTVTGRPTHDNPNHYSPIEPRLTAVASSNGNLLTIVDDNPSNSVVFDIYRNGEPVAKGLNQSSWLDHTTSGNDKACYSVVSRFKQSDHASHLSQMQCIADPIIIDIGSAAVTTNKIAKASEYGLMLKDWGAFEDTFSLDINVSNAKRVAVQFRYRNVNHAINTGITAGVKLVSLKQANHLTSEHVVQLPHTKPDAGVALSTPIYLEIKDGNAKLTMTDFFNMSYLASNNTYSAAGGVSGANNRFDLYGVVVTEIE